MYFNTTIGPFPIREMKRVAGRSGPVLLLSYLVVVSVMYMNTTPYILTSAIRQITPDTKTAQFLGSMGYF